MVGCEVLGGVKYDYQALECNRFQYLVNGVPEFLQDLIKSYNHPKPFHNLTLRSPLESELIVATQAGDE
jgi:hypothetical protein